MEPPPGFNYSKGLVCQLKKSLYGLKQASRCWNKTFSEFLTNFGFSQIIADSCVFSGVFREKKVLLILYVDDALIFCEERKVLLEIIDDLRKRFEATICDTGCFVGMEIDYRQDGTIFLHSESYIKRILKRFNLDGANPHTIPADPGTILSSDSNPLPEGTNIPYREAIGSLMFLAITTRPDIAFVVNVVRRFQSNPGQVHWNAVKRIFRYLKDTRKSTSGYVFILNGPVTWCSQKQSTVSTSTTEAEYIATSTAVKEVLWLRQLLQDVSEIELCDEGITLFVDNQSAIKLIKNPVFHKRTKHIDVRYHFIREKCDDGSVNIKYVKSEEQLADIFTKALPKVKFEKLRELLNIKEINHLCDS
ncbi:Retrovirus-related Pol polyprotein from transposon TNT 1-94 [Araneus ventricosus]|uniref:Retrovirus-related Pol polyprotein from transposon TNT 1-94 n=1 Tax=Araneus ventricosus TaxID=182803 RepID=A0A4Y2H1X2_ARAVE|nr:Retrovirus-related Pol polyprotein from transposon TNT 1-94 [Araneus ventricosus]